MTKHKGKVYQQIILMTSITLRYPPPSSLSPPHVKTLFSTILCTLSEGNVGWKRGEVEEG